MDLSTRSFDLSTRIAESREQQRQTTGNPERFRLRTKRSGSVAGAAVPLSQVKRPRRLENRSLTQNLLSRQKHVRKATCVGPSASKLGAVYKATKCFRNVLYAAGALRLAHVIPRLDAANEISWHRALLSLIEQHMIGPACRSQTVPEPLSVPDAPVFYPSEEDFQRPLEYLASIRPIAESYGLCKIVPPSSWAPPFALNKACFSFKTREQRVSELQQRVDPARKAQEFYSQFRAWHLRTQGKAFTRNPSCAGKDVDLSVLFRLVLRKGGHAQVTKDRGWREICQLLKVGWLQQFVSLALLLTGARQSPRVLSSVCTPVADCNYLF